MAGRKSQAGKDRGEKEEWTLFDAGSLGSELALVKSIFETLGTPNESIWPVRYLAISISYTYFMLTFLVSRKPNISPTGVK